MYEMEKQTIKLLANYDTNIVELNILNIQIVGILCLKEFAELSKLNCEGNKIISLDNLPPSLKSLNCSKNKIRSLNNLPSNIIK